MVGQLQDEKSIFLAALEKVTTEERELYIQGACAGNPQLLRRVRQLLQAEREPLGPLDLPPTRLVTSPTFKQEIAEG